MTIIKIAPYENGAHDNQTTSSYITLPDGYAVLPESVGTPETLENYPFGEITVESIDGVYTVTSWSPLPIPEFDNTLETDAESVIKSSVLSAIDSI